MKTPLEIVNLVHDYLTQLEDAHLSLFLEKWPVSPLTIRSLSPITLPVLTYFLDLAAAANEQASEIVAPVLASARHLCWRQTYTATDFGADFLRKYGWVELVGRRGYVASDVIACGFLLLGPHTYYPPHSHEAAEIYIPLSAPTFWQQGDGAWHIRPIGEPIYHESWLAHSMRTEAVPLLALYLWRGGDLAQKSRIH
jgi:hypothetical protein